MAGIKGKAGEAADEASTSAPLVLVERVANVMVASAVNPCGLALGLFPGQRLADARACVPGLVALAAEPEADARALLGLARWCNRYGPSTNCDGRDGIWIETSGVAHLFGGENKLLQAIGCRLSGFGFTVQIGLADTPGAAWALARYGAVAVAAGKWSQVIAPPGETAKAIAPLVVDALRLDHAPLVLLRRLGLKRISQLQALPRASLKQRFASRKLAEAVLERLDQAEGGRAEPLKALACEAVYEARSAFPEPLITDAGLAACLAHLAHDLCGQLASSRLGLRRAELRVFRADGSVAELGIGTGRPCRQPEHLIKLFGEKLGSIDAGFGIDLVVLCAVAVDPLDIAQTVFATETPELGAWQMASVQDQTGRRGGEGGRHRSGDGRGEQTGDRVVDLVDRLTNRLGARHVLRLSSNQSHLPERAQHLQPALMPFTPPGPATAETSMPAARLYRGGRPLLMLARPEPITVLAEVPEGEPQRFRWRRVLRRVVRAEGPERIEPEWWFSFSPSQGQGGGGHRAVNGASGSLRGGDFFRDCSRDYYRIEDGEGGRYWIFRAGLYRGLEAGHAEAEAVSPAWFLQGLFA